jgi:hypothetical protein
MRVWSGQIKQLRAQLQQAEYMEVQRVGQKAQQEYQALYDKTRRAQLVRRHLGGHVVEAWTDARVR